MAAQLSPRKGKLVHRQTFQNSNCVTELTVKTYPKSARPTLPAPKPFVRDCALQREIERIEKEKKNVKNTATKKAGLHKTDKKGSGGTVSIEVTRKSARKRRHPHIPDGGTWEDVLSQYSSASHHRRSNGSEVLEDQTRTPQQQPLPSSQLQDRHVAPSSNHHFTHSSDPQIQVHLPLHFSHPTSHMHPPPPRTLHPPSQRSTHPPPHSSHPPPHSSYAHTCMHPPQHSSRLPSHPPQYSPHPPTSTHPPQYPSHPPTHTHPPQHSSHPPTHTHPPQHSSHPPTHTHPPQHSSHPTSHTHHPTDTHPAPQPQKLHSHHTPPSTQPQEIPSAPPQQQRQGPLEVNLTRLSSSTTEDIPEPQRPNPPHPSQPDPERAPEHARLISDNASSSPFGDSALQILHRLRVQLQTRAGESECSDLMEALEAIISGRGSVGGVGSKNPQPLPNTPHYHTVFPTPEPTHREQEEQNPLGQQRPVVGDGVPATTTQDHVNNQPEKDWTSDVRTAHGRIEEQVSSCNLLAGGGQNSSSPPYPNTPDSNTSGWGEAGTDKGRHTHNNTILLKEIERQRKVIVEDRKVITSLKTLGSQLIVQQEQMNQKLLEKEGGGSSTAPSSTSLPPQHSAREPDSGLGGERSAHSTTTEKTFTQAGGAESGEGGESGGGGARERGKENLEDGQHTTEDLWQEKEREYRVVILDLQTENEALRQEMDRLRELVETLEVQLTRAQDQLSKNHCGNSSRSKVASSAPHLTRPVRRKRPKSDMSSRRAAHSSTESNADSAYEERTGSHLTSKTSSPYSDRPHPTSTTSVLLPIPANTSVLHHHLVGQNYDERSRATDLNNGEECSDAGPSCWHQCGTNLVPPPDHQPEQRVLTNCDQLAGGAVDTHGSCQVTSDRNQRTAPPVSADYLIRPFTMPELRPTARDLKSWVAPEDLTSSSFSTVSDHNFQDSKVSLESSFLQGIGAPRSSNNEGVEKSTLSTAFTSRTHQGTPHLPLESTRVQDISPPKSMSGVEGDTISMAVHTRHSTSSPTTTTTPLPTVDILD